jgi:hypothetical protein
MKSVGKYILLCLFITGCFTTEEDRKNLKVESTDNMSMDFPDEDPDTPASEDGDGLSEPLVVIEDGVVSYQKPSKSSKILKKLKKWQEVTVIRTQGDWSEIKGLGWVKSSQLGE